MSGSSREQALWTLQCELEKYTALVHMLLGFEREERQGQNQDVHELELPLHFFTLKP